MLEKLSETVGRSVLGGRARRSGRMLVVPTGDPDASVDPYPADDPYAADHLAAAGQRRHYDDPYRPADPYAVEAQAEVDPYAAHRSPATDRYAAAEDDDRYHEVSWARRGGQVQGRGTARPDVERVHSGDRAATGRSRMADAPMRPTSAPVTVPLESAPLERLPSEPVPLERMNSVPLEPVRVVPVRLGVVKPAPPVPRDVVSQFPPAHPAAAPSVVRTSASRTTGSIAAQIAAAGHFTQAINRPVVESRPEPVPAPDASEVIASLVRSIEPPFTSAPTSAPAPAPAAPIVPVAPQRVAPPVVQPVVQPVAPPVVQPVAPSTPPAQRDWVVGRGALPPTGNADDLTPLFTATGRRIIGLTTPLYQLTESFLSKWPNGDPLDSATPVPLDAAPAIAHQIQEAHEAGLPPQRKIDTMRPQARRDRSHRYRQVGEQTGSVAASQTVEPADPVRPIELGPGRSVPPTRLLPPVRSETTVLEPSPRDHPMTSRRVVHRRRPVDVAAERPDATPPVRRGRRGLTDQPIIGPTVGPGDQPPTGRPAGSGFRPGPGGRGTVLNGGSWDGWWEADGGCTMSGGPM